MYIHVDNSEQLLTICRWWYKKHWLPYNKWRIKMPWETIPFSYYQLQTHLSKPALVATLFPVAVRPDNSSIDVEKMYNLIGDYMGDRFDNLITYDDWEASGREYIRE